MRQLSQKGLSLVEVTVALGLIGVASFGLMRLQGAQTKAARLRTINEDIQDKTRILQYSLQNRAVCTNTLRGKGAGDTIGEFVKATIDPNDFEKIIPTTDVIIKAKDTENQTAVSAQIENMEIISESGRDYLEVTFNRDPLGNRKLGSPTIKKRMIILGEKDAFGKFVNCYGENTNQSLTSDTLVCESMGGSMVGGDCQYLSGIFDTTATNCGPGSTYQLKEESGQIKLTCEECVPSDVFVRWDCEKKVRNKNWVNICYYKNGCAGKPSVAYGHEWWVPGPTSANGGDTGSRSNCVKKRRKCAGEP